MTIDLIVTRHLGLREVLLETGIATPETPVVAHANADDVRGQHVAGVLPLALAAECASVTEVALNIPAALRGCELTAEQVREHMTSIRTYRVLELTARPDLDIPVYELARRRGIGHTAIAKLAEKWRIELRRLWEVTA